MLTPISTLLKNDLSRTADYKTIQLLKAGDFSSAAVIVLKARRNAVRNCAMAFLAYVAVTVVAMLCFMATSFYSEQAITVRGLMPWIVVMLLSTVPLVQLIGAMHATTRLEMLLMVWLMEAPNSQDLAKAAIWELLDSFR